MEDIVTAPEAAHLTPLLLAETRTLHTVRHSRYSHCPMKRPGVPPSVRLSVPLRRVYCCGPGRREISIDCCTAHCSVWAVSRCQPNTEACIDCICRVCREMTDDEDGAHSIRLISTACRPPTRSGSSAPLDQSVTKTLVYDDDIACVGQTWNWVIGSPGQWVIWVIFHHPGRRVAGSSF